MKRSYQSGFSAVFIVVIIVVLMAAALSMFSVLRQRNSSGASATNTTNTLQTKADVTKAASSLDANNVDTTIDADQLNDDITALY